jgi:hypothetical protein
MKSKRAVFYIMIVAVFAVASNGCGNRGSSNQTVSDSRNDTLPDITSEQDTPTVEVLDLAGCFGFADAEGQRIIAQTDDKSIQGFDIAVGHGGTVAEVKFSGMQEGTEENNYRDTEYNFDNLAGSIFEKTKGDLNSGNTHFLTGKSFERSLIPFIIPENGTRMDAETVKRIEKQKNRKIAASLLLAQTAAGAEIYELTFERKGDDVLGSLVYADGDKTVYRDYPATYDETSTWRVDDGGEFGGLNVLFLARTVHGLIICVTWAAPEGEGTDIFIEKDGTFADTDFGYSRYWSPR